MSRPRAPSRAPATDLPPTSWHPGARSRRSPPVDEVTQIRQPLPRAPAPPRRPPRPAPDDTAVERAVPWTDTFGLLVAPAARAPAPRPRLSPRLRLALGAAVAGVLVGFVLGLFVGGVLVAPDLPQPDAVPGQAIEVQPLGIDRR